MTILIQGGTIVSMDKGCDPSPRIGDILIEGDRIKEVADRIEVPLGAEVIDARQMVVIPGLVNGHLHSWEGLFKGRYDNRPLELWALYAYPVVGLMPLSTRLIYLRTMLVGMEALKNGVTCVVDDVIEMPGQSLDALDAVFRAYEDLGIRANCSGHVINKAYVDTIPFAREIFPPDLLKEIDSIQTPTADSYIAFSKDAISRWHGKSGRLRYVIAPSAPQRCTEDLMVAAAQLAQEHGAQYHTHVLETKVQAVTGNVFYGRSLIKYLHDLGILNDHTTIAHSIWVTQEDIEIMSQTGCSVVHNPISNLKLGAGVAPLRQLLNARVNVALGSDGISSSDTPRMFDVMHVAALVHKVSSSDYGAWPTSAEILHAATLGGAKSALLSEDIGSIAAGKKADLVLLRMDSLRFTPLNNVCNHLVYSENGESICKVVVDGQIVVDNGRILTINEGELLAELRASMAEFFSCYARVEEINKRLEPYVAGIYARCCAEHVGLNRMAC